MLFVSIPELINTLLLSKSSQIWDTSSLGEPLSVQRTKEAHFGDYQSNLAFRLSKIAKSSPKDVALRLHQEFTDSPMIDRVEVAGPGFLNFWLDNDWLVQRLKSQVRDTNHGISQVGEGQTVVIDYSSPNVAKRMHIGHMRSTIIGNALDRIHRAAGYTVVADNHIGDWGTQFGKLIVMWHRSHDPERFELDPIAELERLYVLFSQVSTDELEAAAREETAKLQRGEPENYALWQRFISESLKEFDGVYKRLGIQFDEVLGESAYNEMLPGVVSELCDKNIAVESDDAIIVAFPKKSKPKMLSETVLVIQKSDGAFLYGTTDLATLKFRSEKWNPSKIIYVTDLRQQLHFQQVFSVRDQWREQNGETHEERQSPKLEHVWFGMLKLPEGAMSTRKGNVIRLVDLINEAVRRAKAVVDQKSPMLSEEQRERIAEAVGIGAIRYFDLSQNPQSDVIFDWDRMLALEGNTAPFLMYSYARGRGIQRKGGIENPSVESLEVHDDVARQLILKCLEIPEIVISALEQSKPNVLCDQLYTLATLFNRFYFSNPVLSEPDESIRSARLSVVEATLIVLGNGLKILGLQPLSRM